MLPKDLLEVRKSKGKIYPKFADERYISLAERVIEVFISGKGKKYGLVLSILKSLENARNYRKVRGFARIMDRFCEKACMFDSPDPAEVRLFLFKRGYTTTKKERQQAIEYAAEHFNTTPQIIEKAMFADKEEEFIITDVKYISPEMLIKLYNLSLLQTTLFNSLRLTFWISSGHKDVFRRIKWLGLMYDLYNKNGQTIVEITGVASILKMTRKYGVSMAKLIPSIIKSGEWWIKADILDDNTKRVYHLEVDNEYSNLFPEQEEKIEYDSSLEKEFAGNIKAIMDVEVIREPGVIKSGKYAFIPDFLIKAGEKEVYVEIVGFWTDEYLKKKLKKIHQANLPIIVIAREEYGEGESEDVIMFSKKIPYNKVIKRIDHYLKGDVDDIEFEGDIINLMELSKVHRVPVSQISRKIPERYILAGSYAVKQEVFERLKKEVKEVNPRRLSDITPILKKYGVGSDILQAMGYEVKWTSLSEENANIRKIM